MAENGETGTPVHASGYRGFMYNWQARFRELNEVKQAVLCLVPNVVVHAKSGKQENVWDIVQHGIDDYDKSLVSRSKTIEGAIELAFDSSR